MGLILNLETATKICSVSLAESGKVIAIEEEQHGEYIHAEKLTVFVSSVMKKAKLSLNEVDAIAVSMGPGSYTGLRIGVSAAKGLCYALDIPLIGVSTLKQMALSAARDLKNRVPQNTLFCPMIDARRMEVYCAVYNNGNEAVEEVEAKIIDPNSFNEILSAHPVYFFGDGADKCKDTLSTHPNAVFVDNYYPSAAGMAPLSEESFGSACFENVAYFEPYYLKDFVTTIPKKKF